jgi:hypothetical protein
MQELNRMIDVQEKRLQEREERQKHNNASQNIQTIPVKPSTSIKTKIIFKCLSALVVVFTIAITISKNIYSDSDRKADIAKFESMKRALDSDIKGIKTFEEDQKEGKPISNDRYNWYLHIIDEYEIGVLSYNEIAKKTGSPNYSPQ